MANLFIVTVPLQTELGHLRKANRLVELDIEVYGEKVDKHEICDLAVELAKTRGADFKNEIEMLLHPTLRTAENMDTIIGNPLAEGFGIKLWNIRPLSGSDSPLVSDQ